MRRKIYLLKLKDLDLEIINKDREILIININLFLDNDLYRALELTNLNYLFNNSSTKREYENYTLYYDFNNYPNIEYIKCYDWIDYLDLFYQKYYPNKIDRNEKLKNKYRNNILNSLIKKNNYELENKIDNDLLLNLEINNSITIDN